MSRFYDGLREANRLHADEMQPDLDGDWDHSTAAAEAPPDLDTLSQPHVPDSANPPNPKPSAWEVAPELQPAQAQQSVARATFAKLLKFFVNKEARIFPNAVDSAVIENYRRLRTKLVQQHSLQPFRSLVVTSPNPQEGKTVTTLNLALSFAMLPSFRVALVDADLRRASLSKWIGIGPRPGLSNLLDGTATLDDAVIRSEDTPVQFIVSGTSQMPAAELLHSPALKHHFRQMTERFDLVLVDSPPINLITDTQLIAASCDAVLVVARAFSTTCRALEKATQDLSPFRIVGTVLNGATRASLRQRYTGYY